MIAPNFPVTYDATPAEDQPARADIGEQTGPQQVAGDWLYSFGWGCANGGTPANPCGFPQYGTLYRGTYQTYRFILNHPIIRQARAQVFNPIIALKWGYEAKPDTPQERVDFVRDTLERLRFQLVSDMLRGGLDYGHCEFEKIWAMDGGYLVYDRLKPLRPELAGLLADKHGNFAGVRWNGMEPDDLDVHKSFHWAHDAEAGNLFGRSQLENIRETGWRDWLDAATDLYLLTHNKVSGIMPVVYTPAGDTKVPNPAGGFTTIAWKQIGMDAVNNLRIGKGIHLTHLGAITPQVGMANFDQLMQLIKVGAVRVDVIDFGNQGPAITSILERMRHDEELMFAGYLLSPRTGMESQHGSRADATEHTNTGVINSENLATDIAGAVSKGLVDDLLVLNFGAEAKGSVWVNPGKLTDENLAIDNKILDAVLADPDLRGQFIEQIDIDSIAERRNIPKLLDIIKLEQVASDTLEEPVAALEGADAQE